MSLETENPRPAEQAALPQEDVDEDGGEVGSVTAAASLEVSPSKVATATTTATTSIEEEKMAEGKGDRGVEFPEPSTRVETTQELMRVSSELKLSYVRVV